MLINGYTLYFESVGNCLGRLRPIGPQSVHGCCSNQTGRPRLVQHGNRLVQTLYELFSRQCAHALGRRSLRRIWKGAKFQRKDSRWLELSVITPHIGCCLHFVSCLFPCQSTVSGCVNTFAAHAIDDVSLRFFFFRLFLQRAVDDISRFITCFAQNSSKEQCENKELKS